MVLRTFKDRKKGSQIAYQQNEIHKSQKIIGPLIAKPQSAESPLM
jgi:hypothetical protein